MQQLAYLLAALLLTSPALSAESSPDPLWRSVYRDDFERTQLGSDWLVLNGNAAIQDGKLVLNGSGATAMINRPFAADVKVVFTAQAAPDAVPCDLSVALGSDGRTGYHYLLAFGSNHNRWNQICSPRCERDENPKRLIEPGRKHHLVAVKEGRTLSYYADGEKILEQIDPDPVAGPGFDHVGLVTWNGLIADDIEVLERVTPAPDSPRVITALPTLPLEWNHRQMKARGELPSISANVVSAYNDRRFIDVSRYLPHLTPEIDAFTVFAYVLGDIAYEERPADMQRLAAWAGELRKSPENARWTDFLTAAEWFSRISISSRDEVAVRRLTALGPENNPFYHKARLYFARYHRAHCLEGHQLDRLAMANDIFADLRKIWPEHGGLRELTGETVPWGVELIHEAEAGPAWVRHLQEAFARQQAVLTWWFTQRQAADGQLGGGWGDDVEILRGWVPIACITTAARPVIAGIERLADGVWRHALQDGYERGSGDVEHSAEPSADSLPTMMLLRYGDPRWISRNLGSAKTIRERFMGINERGRLQFFSTEFGADRVLRQPSAGGDTGYHARAMKHFIWLAWYGVPEARETLLAWCDTWREAILARIGSKPPGFAPASIFFPSGGIDPPDGKPWHHAGSHYYGFPGLPGMIHEAMLTAYFISGDRKYLEPVEQMMQLATAGPLRQFRDDRPADDADNLLAMAAHQPGWRCTAEYRWLTGSRAYDDLLRRWAITPTQRHLVNGDLRQYMNAFEPLAVSLRKNWHLRTTEVLQTDRAGLEGALEVLGAYTGAVADFRDAAPPTMSVTWDTPSLDFAALVTQATPERLRVRVYHFEGAPLRMGLRLWRLSPGRCTLAAGAVVAGEDASTPRYDWKITREFTLEERGQTEYVEVPPRAEWLIDVRLVEPAPRPRDLPDVAIGSADIRREDNDLAVRVYNLGGATARDVNVVLETHDGQGWHEHARVSAADLPPVTGFEPATRDLRIPCDPITLARALRVTLMPANLPEITRTNNAASLEVAKK